MFSFHISPQSSICSLPHYLIIFNANIFRIGFQDHLYQHSRGFFIGGEGSGVIALFALLVSRPVSARE